MYTQAAAFESVRPRGSSAEELIRGHLEPLLRFVGFVTEDDETSEDIVQESLRDAVSGGALHALGLYRAACQQLRARADCGRAMDTLERTGSLCLLLKDLAGLRYAEIAEVLSIDAMQVRVNIASARAALLPAI